VCWSRKSAALQFKVEARNFICQSFSIDRESKCIEKRGADPSQVGPWGECEFIAGENLSVSLALSGLLVVRRPPQALRPPTLLSLIKFNHCRSDTRRQHSYPSRLHNPSAHDLTKIVQKRFMGGFRTLRSPNMLALRTDVLRRTSWLHLPSK